MAGQESKDKLAFAARISQKLNGPSEAIVGFHTLLTEELRRTGPQAALKDLQKIGIAAGNLSRMVEMLGTGSRQLSTDKDAQAQLRHDLRSPLNAILGYAEMMLEDFEAELGPSARRDIVAILTEARKLVVQIDSAIDGADRWN